MRQSPDLLNEEVRAIIAQSPFDEERILMWVSPGNLRALALTHHKHHSGRISGDFFPYTVLKGGIWVWEGFVKGVYFETTEEFPEPRLDHIDYEGAWRLPTPAELEMLSKPDELVVRNRTEDDQDT